MANVTLLSLLCRVEGSVQTLDWQNPQERAVACESLQRHAEGAADGPTAPLLIKRAVADWPALERWTLPDLAERYPDFRCLFARPNKRL